MSKRKYNQSIFERVGKLSVVSGLAAVIVATITFHNNETNSLKIAFYAIALLCCITGLTASLVATFTAHKWQKAKYIFYVMVCIWLPWLFLLICGRERCRERYVKNPKSNESFCCTNKAAFHETKLGYNRRSDDGIRIS